MLKPCLLSGYLFAISSFFMLDAMAENKPVDVSAVYLFDQRGFNSITLQLASNRLPAGLSLWGFTDFLADQEDPDSRTDIDRSFSEYRLSYNKLGIKGLGLQAEYNYSRPSRSELGRLGLTYKKVYKLANRYTVFNQLRLFPLETDGDGGQVSLIYSVKFSDKWLLSGFADYNVRENLSNEWVIEPMLRYYFHKKVAVALEYRFNGFEDANPALDGDGIAIGIWADF